MPKISKYYDKSADIKPFEGLTDFASEKKRELEMELESIDKIEIKDPKEEGISRAERERRLRKAKRYEEKKTLTEAEKKAEEIINAAHAEAEKIKARAANDGESEGFDIGFKAGYKKAYDENKARLDSECSGFLHELETCIRDVESKKNEIINNYKGELKDLALAIAEKVIHVSLKSSGEVIEKMILSSTDKLKTKSWAKIYISKGDAQRLMEGDSDFLRSISHISENVKIIAMDNENEGTCIVELPDQIIDSSVQTQLDNIKEILNNVGV